jgi:hypothetical protein
MRAREGVMACSEMGLNKETLDKVRGWAQGEGGGWPAAAEGNGWARVHPPAAACCGPGLPHPSLQPALPTPPQMTPIVPTWQSDSGSMDGLLELLTRCGRDVAEVRGGRGLPAA